MFRSQVRTSVLYFHHARTMVAGLWWLRRVSLGARVRVSGRPRVVVERGGRMVIADRVQIYSTLARTELVAGATATLEIGERTLVNFGTSIVATDHVSIGANCHIGPHCIIADTSFHEVDPDRRGELPMPRPVTIEENVWLGARTIVMPGVRIGRDAAVGAGSVVTHDVEARTLVAGVPARLVRKL